MGEHRQRGFLATLFDCSFDDFLTPGVLKLLDAIGLLAALCGALRFIGGGFGRGLWTGIGALLLAPRLFVVYSLVARVVVELVMVFFRIAEHMETRVEVEGRSPRRRRGRKEKDEAASAADAPPES